MRHECLGKSEEEKCFCNGGDGCYIYQRPNTVPSFDKGGHKTRSLVDAPVHRKHWKKEVKKGAIDQTLGMIDN